MIDYLLARSTCFFYSDKSALVEYGFSPGCYVLSPVWIQLWQDCVPVFLCSYSHYSMLTFTKEHFQYTVTKYVGRFKSVAAGICAEQASKM